MSHFTTDTLATTASVTAIVGDATPAAMSAEEEASLVLAAQAGDEAAVFALMRQYGPALRNAVGRIGEALSTADAEQEATLALLTLVHAHDPSTGRLAGRVKAYLADGLQEAAAKAGTWSIPTRQVKRYLSIVKACEGNLRAAYDLVCEGGQDIEPMTFLAVARALRDTGSTEAMAEHALADGGSGAEAGLVVGAVTSDAFAAIEDSLLVDGLLALLDERETPIVRYAYGFDSLPVTAEEAKEGNARTREEGIAVVNDSVVARHLGMTRATVQRTRSKALATMRAAVVGEEV